MSVKKKQSILIVSQHYYPESFRINDLAEGLTEDGYDVEVLCGLPNYPSGNWFSGYSYLSPRKERHGNVAVTRCAEIRRKGNTSARIFLNYVSWPLCASIRALRYKRKSFDVVLCYNTSPVLMILPAAIAAGKIKAPLVTYILDIWPENLYSVLEVKSQTLRKIAESVSNRLYKKSNRLIALSNSIKIRLLDRLGQEYSSENIDVIPQHAEQLYEKNEVNIGLRKQFGDDTIILFAGNFSPAQNLDTAILALKLVKDSGISTIKLVLVGDGMSKQELETLVSDCNLEKDVFFYGRVAPEDIPALNGAADALLVPLRAGKDLNMTIPAKLASCLASRKPIIACLEGEAANVIHEANCGLVCTPGNAEELAAAYIKIYRMDNESRKTMGNNAFHYYSSNFSRGIILNKLEQSFHRAATQYDNKPQ